MAYIDLDDLPSPNKVYSATLSGLYGGLNENAAPYDISSNQCSKMQNMIWHEGRLRGRPGLKQIGPTPDTAPVNVTKSVSGETVQVTPLSMFSEAWHGKLFFQGDNGLYYCDPTDTTSAFAYTLMTPTFTSTTAGSWFRFDDYLFFKGSSQFYRISYNEVTEVFTLENVMSTSNPLGYVPVIQINTARDGVGDLWQPENRISSQKIVWFTADDGANTEEIVCDGTSRTYSLEYDEQLGLASVRQVYLGASLLTPTTDYTVDLANGKIALTSTVTPSLGLKLTVREILKARNYNLPVTQIDSIDSVVVGGTAYEAVSSSTELAEGKYYAPKISGSTLYSGEIIFYENLGTFMDSIGNANKIVVTYTKDNVEAQRVFDSCTIACTFGGSGIEENCAVLGGIVDPQLQTNVFIWSGNDLYGANPLYWPIENYNLVGEYDDKITGFGRQQDKLVIFQTHRVSAGTFSVETVDDRTVISIDVKAINDRIGCDIPNSIQLCDNNLVWAHTEYGVCYLKDATYAYETLVATNISFNVSSSLKADIKTSESCCSVDYDDKYWLYANNNCYVWDYGVQPYTSDHSKLCWFKMTPFNKMVATAISDDKIYWLRNDNSSDLRTYICGQEYGRYKDVPVFTSGVAADKAIERFFSPQMQLFGGFSTLKDISKLVMLLPTDVRVMSSVYYLTDYLPNRQDPTALDNQYEYTARLNATPKIAAVRIRKPKARHVHQFQVSFESDATNADLCIESIQIFYSYGGTAVSGVRM